MALVLFLLAIIYLPLMIAKENFASNLTLFAFNVAVFFLFANGLMTWLTSERKQNMLTWSISIWLLLTGIYAFNFQFVNPLKEEYKALRKHIATNFKAGTNKVYFIRAERNLFKHNYHTNVYKDEFGLPSTFKDWVPEPITRQLVYELTGDRTKAGQLDIVQFETIDAFKAAQSTPDAHSIVIDMNQLVE
jgi:hypothetical protein